MPRQFLHKRATQAIFLQWLPPLATDRPMEMSPHTRGSSPTQPTESASQPSASSNGMQTGFLPKCTSSGNGFRWGRLIFALFRKQNLSLKSRRRPSSTSPPSAQITPHHTSEAGYSPWEKKTACQRIAEDYQPIHNLYAAPIRGQDTLALAPTEPGNLFLASGNLNAHSPLWNEHQPADERGELVEEWLLSQNASTFNDGTATCVNRRAGGLSMLNITAVSNAWSTGTEWTVSEDLGSDHLPITTTIRCEEARWQPSLQLDGAILNTTSPPRFLGVNIDRALFFGPHVATVVYKASNRCRVLASLTYKRWGWRKVQLFKVYRALHLSVINYAAQLGNPGWPQPN